jgi:hypothetical protein
VSRVALQQRRAKEKQEGLFWHSEKEKCILPFYGCHQGNSLLWNLGKGGTRSPSADKPNHDTGKVKADPGRDPPPILDDLD